jgi:16S rRNA processing protein RimM
MNSEIPRRDTGRAAGRPGEILAVGRIRRPHGVRGEVLAEITTDFPERLAAGVEVGVGAQEPERWLAVADVRIHKGCFLLRLNGVGTRDAAEALRGAWLFLPAQARAALPANYYYEHELAGLACVLADGTRVGEVSELGTETGLPMLTVRTQVGEALVPFASPIVVSVDLGAGVVVIDPPAGLLDGDAL